MAMCRQIPASIQPEILADIGLAGKEDQSPRRCHFGKENTMTLFIGIYVKTKFRFSNQRFDLIEKRRRFDDEDSMNPAHKETLVN